MQRLKTLASQQNAALMPIKLTQRQCRLYARECLAVLRRLSQSGTLAYSPETEAALRDLDSQCSAPRVIDSNAPNSITLFAQFVGPALRGIKQLAPRPSGLSADHLLLGFPSGFSDSIVIVLKSIAEGRAPSWLADARLLALPKNNGGVRPIAVSETLRRLAATVRLRSLRMTLPHLARQFIIRQDGCITVANIVRSALKSNNEFCVATVDLRNAFN